MKGIASLDETSSTVLQSSSDRQTDREAEFKWSAKPIGLHLAAPPSCLFSLTRTVTALGLRQKWLHASCPVYCRLLDHAKNCELIQHYRG